MDDDTPSPDKALPDIAAQKTDDDSIASGDDSASWDKETERVMHLFAAQAIAEAMVDEADMAAVNEEVQEWTLLTNEEAGREEAANANPAPPPRWQTNGVEARCLPTDQSQNVEGDCIRTEASGVGIKKSPIQPTLGLHGDNDGWRQHVQLPSHHRCWCNDKRSKVGYSNPQGSACR